MVEFAVVIPVFNDWDRLNQVLSDLKRQSDNMPAQCEVIIVDNGSKDLKSKLAEECGFTVLSCAQPGSYAARNHAVRYAKGKDFFLFTDSDCQLSNNWVCNALLEYVSSPDSLVAGGISMYSCSEVPNFVESYDIVLGLPQKRYVRRGYAVTANLMVPHSVFQKVGLFDDTRFSGGDADFCRRGVAQGVPLRYSERMMVFHPARSSIKEILTKLKRVQGARVTRGSRYMRLRNALFIFLPPARAVLYIAAHQGAIGMRLKALLTLFLLWPFSVYAMLLGVFSSNKTR